ncbi:MAG: cysteine synthase family protein [Bacteriovoracaceae bacterium]|nr:cysteine synthase family protein [Bacteriovoracaceae bacterium]
MKHLNKTILDVIGNTPIIKINKLAKHVSSDIYVKLEFMNPGGSIKDRLGYVMCKKAVERGQLKPGGIIIEATSGNTGVGISMFAAIHGYKAVFVMADKQSQEKINNLKAFGAEVITCPTNVAPEDPRSYYSVAALMAKEIPNSVFMNQYDNKDNFACHYEWTGPEIFEQTRGEFDVYCAGVGTGGTISGTGTYLKEKIKGLKVVGVDIEGSILAHYHKTKEVIEGHGYVLEGIGEDFLPDNVKFDVIDEFVMVKDEESFQMTRRMLKEEGIYAGGSCGAALLGAIRYAETLKTPKRILTVLPDSGNRYAGRIYNDQWMREKGYQVNTDTKTQDLIQKILKNAGVKL